MMRQCRRGITRTTWASTTEHGCHMSLAHAWTSFDPTRQQRTLALRLDRRFVLLEAHSCLSFLLVMPVLWRTRSISNVEGCVQRPARRRPERQSRRTRPKKIKSASAREAMEAGMGRPVVWFAAGVDRAHNSCRPTTTLNQPQTLLPLINRCRRRRNRWGRWDVWRQRQPKGWEEAREGC